MLLIFLALNIAPLANAEFDYTDCVRRNYFGSNSGPLACDFSNMRVNMGSMFRSCSMELFQKTPTEDLTKLTAEIDKKKTEALASINHEVNGYLYGCGYMGNIEYTENGGDITVVKFQADSKSCQRISNLIRENDVLISNSDYLRGAEIQIQNNLLQQTYEKFNCGNSAEISPEIKLQVESVTAV